MLSLCCLRVCCSCLGSKCNPWGVGWAGFARDPVGCVCVCAQSGPCWLLVEVEVMTVGTTTNCVCIHLHRRANEETTMKQTFFIVPPQEVLK